MKKIDPRVMKHIAKTYQNYAGDEDQPQASEVQDQATDQLLGQEENNLAQTPPPGFDGSPEANPNVHLSQSTLDAADLPPTPDPTAPQNAPAQPAPPTDPRYAQVGVPDIEGALQEEKSANTEKAKAESDQGKAEALALDAAQKKIAALPTASDITKRYKATDDALFQAYQNKKLDPQRYLHSLSTGQKIGNGIALLLSGIGSGASGQPNLAAKMIDENIQRDIDAQKNSQDQSMNLWKMNKEEYGNDLAANLATQNQILLGTKAQLEQAAANAKGPLAQANASAGNALIDQKLAENRFKLSLMQPTSDSFGLDPAKKVTWLVPPAQQAKVFDEIDAAQNTTRNAAEALKTFDQAAEEVRPLTSLSHGHLPSGTAFIPGMESANQKALHAILGPTFKDVEGALKIATMDNIFKSVTPSFADDDTSIKVKRNALITYLNSKSSAPAASGFGINLKDYPSTNVKAAIPPEPDSPEGKQKAREQAPIKYDAQGRAWMKNAQGQVVPAK